MKKFIAVLLTLTLAFAFCVPSFAEDTTAASSDASVIDQLLGALSKVLPADTIEKLLGSLMGGGDSSATIEYDQAMIDDLEMKALFMDPPSTDQADEFISYMQTQYGLDKPVIENCLQYLLDNGKITQDQYAAFVSACARAADTENPSVTMPAGGSGSGSGSLFPDISLPDGFPNISLPDGFPNIDIEAPGSATELIQMLKDAGVPANAMQTVVDALHTAGVIDDSIYNEATNMINANESTTDASNEGGIGGFLGGIVDKVSGLFGGLLGGGSDDSNGGSGSSDEFGAGPATGDTALISVVAVAAVAGAALLLTKKKEDK